MMAEVGATETIPGSTALTTLTLGLREPLRRIDFRTMVAFCTFAFFDRRCTGGWRGGACRCAAPIRTPSTPSAPLGTLTPSELVGGELGCEYWR